MSGINYVSDGKWEFVEQQSPLFWERKAYLGDKFKLKSVIKQCMSKLDNDLEPIEHAEEVKKSHSAIE